MAVVAAKLASRQLRNCTRTPDGFIDETSCYVPFWSTRTGTIVKWSLFFGIIAIVGLYLLLGYVHAQKRLRKGLAPLGYHRFLVSRSALAQIDPRYRYPQPANTTIHPYGPDSQYYGMHAMPPPVYDPNAPRLPVYEPPAGSTKAEPSQQHQLNQPATGASAEHASPPGPPPISGPPPDYTPPPGPPPRAAESQSTESTNPFRS
ncbi:hypothetical protein MMYC01_204274 [Madurella mycetomatis]|uniref:Uncharacterized protein n=1 Tax=Madurella mycetomatis TaxID=100816 RepID=A0A175W4K5_9PEZI|nr:hypothetical protein MMYC01_204274 [Madurella mycetomatis]